MKIGRKLYFDKSTGEIITDTGERQGAVIKTTIEQDIAAYKALFERNRDTFDVLELTYGRYTNDFASAKSYRVNPTTKELEFSEVALSEPSLPPISQPPLIEKVEELEALWLYDSMMKDLAIEEANAAQADLMYQLMLKGVI